MLRLRVQSSREIPELVESRHDSVKRTIERLAERGVIQLPPLVGVKNHLGQQVLAYHVGKRDSYVIVAQLSPEFTARLVDRWQELEAEKAGASNTSSRDVAEHFEKRHADVMAAIAALIAQEPKLPLLNFKEGYAENSAGPERNFAF
jgi:phage regulator Rha-like protein